MIAFITSSRCSVRNMCCSREEGERGRERGEVREGEEGGGGLAMCQSII